MQFAHPRDARRRPPAEPAFWRHVVFASAAVGAVAATRPWVQVLFTRLFGELSGPPAWQSSAGFTCLCTCALVAVMTLAETPSRAARVAVRPASLVLVAVMTLALLLQASEGPGHLRGVTATWTAGFYAGAAAALVLLAACAVRYAATDPRPEGARDPIRPADGTAPEGGPADGDPGDGDPADGDPGDGITGSGS